MEVSVFLDGFGAGVGVAFGFGVGVAFGFFAVGFGVGVGVTFFFFFAFGFGVGVGVVFAALASSTVGAAVTMATPDWQPVKEKSMDEMIAVNNSLCFFMCDLTSFLYL
jgi:hypothetical protein